MSDVELGLEGQSLLLAVGVFLRTKTDHRTVNANTEETLASQYEEKFSVSTTENTFDKETDVALQVILKYFKLIVEPIYCFLTDF